MYIVLFLAGCLIGWLVGFRGRDEAYRAGYEHATNGWPPDLEGRFE